ncbi:OmpA family protein [uncultured Tenacibaculum sp.]|uniref:OmpA family protein n=1 Tax=uncultured Tenacibaculum sp. TaxID=174713 RepID=UPI00261B34E7|nr:OmpA family protein [uncultured Tenacibaculum sp.]
MKVYKIRKGVLTILLLFFAVSYSQSRKIADRYFKEFEYVKAAELYKELYALGDRSKHVLTKLADSYYNHVNTEDAEFWYEKLMIDFKGGVSNDYLLKYAQVLRSNKKYKKSDSIFSLLRSSGKLRLSLKEKVSDSLFELTEGTVERINIKNLNVNSQFSDYGGYIFNNEVYYSSSSIVKGKEQKMYGWNNQPFLNIYKARMKLELIGADTKKDTILNIYNSEILKAPVTTKYHEGKPIFTKDGKTMYFTRNNFNGKRLSKGLKSTVNLKIFRAEKIDDIWTNITELPFNSNNYSVGHPTLSLDERTLYFTSDMPGGYGKTDLYKVSVGIDGSFGTPKNLGAKINTSEREVFPFIGKDNRLYFSSDGHFGLGLLDIYKVKSKLNNEYLEIENLGSPFNSSKDDFAFYLHDNGKYGFFSSNRKQGKGDDDIYSFYVYEETPCKQNIEGFLIDYKTKKPIDRGLVTIINQNGEVIDEVLTDTEGKYILPSIKCAQTYTLKGHKFDYRSTQKVINVTSQPLGDVNLSLMPLVVENQIVIKPIYFDFNKYDIRDDAKYELENIYTIMTRHPEIVIRIESHTDSRGTFEHNLSLSSKRALATKNYLINRGINPKRIISAKGFGESRLLNNCVDENVKCSEEEHSVNRRSYFFIVEGLKEIKARQLKERLKANEKMENRRKKIKELRKHK